MQINVKRYGPTGESVGPAARPLPPSVGVPAVKFQFGTTATGATNPTFSQAFSSTPAVVTNYSTTAGNIVASNVTTTGFSLGVSGVGWIAAGY